uniref:Uncharacterized protein n=1 Tax=Tetradesmus obliquus TaxID=3088 RepID=A0A383W7I0_TETOB|eukprot:jgi/Sobl393_1/15802/SZX73605.1
MQQHEINRIAAADAVRTNAAATSAPAAAGASAPAAGTSSSITSTTTTAAAAGQQPAREPDSSKLQQQKYFTIFDLTGSRAIEIGTTLTWREGQLLRPAADSAYSPADRKLVKVEARGEQHSGSGSEASWVTACGYLQWGKSRREVQFTAEVDGCSEVINYAARRRDDPDYPAQFGLLLITVAVDNCVYSHCEQAGCGSACKCISKQTGECSCGDSTQTGFAPHYSWPQNRQSCAHNKISVAADSSSRDSGDGSSREESATLFEARRGSGKIVVPIRFGSTANCLPPMASRRLQVHSVKCTKTSSRADNSRQAVPAKPAAAAAQAGSLQGGCNRADGTYLVVVGVPSAVGQYSCSVTFNDDWEDRRLAELRVI